MANIEINSFADFKAFLAQIPEMKLREKALSDDLGSLKFSRIKKEIDLLYELNRQISKISSTSLPDGLFQMIKSPANQLSAALRNIISFRISGQNPDREHEGIVGEFQRYFNEFYVTTSLIVRDINNEILNQEIERMTKTAEIKSAEIDKLHKSAVEATREIGITIHAKDFLSEADDRKNEADNWLKITISISIATIASPMIIPFFLNQLFSDSFQIISSKIVMIAIMISASLWCGRIYKANKHQESLNRHKAIALSTFKTFVTATEDTQIKNAVLLEATRAIFSTPTTGYVATGDQPSNEMTILEMVKNIPK